MPLRAMRGVMPRAQPPAQMVVVVPLVGMQLGGAAPTRSAARADGRDAADKGFEDLAVVGTRAGDPKREGQTGLLGDQVDL